MKANGSPHFKPRHYSRVSEQLHAPQPFCSRGNSPCSHWTDGLVGTLETKNVSSLLQTQPRFLGLQALYRLHNPCFVRIRTSSLGARLEDVDLLNSLTFGQIHCLGISYSRVRSQNAHMMHYSTKKMISTRDVPQGCHSYVWSLSFVQGCMWTSIRDYMTFVTRVVTDEKKTPYVLTYITPKACIRTTVILTTNIFIYGQLFYGNYW